MDLIESQNKTNTRRHPWEMARVEVVKKLIKKHYTNLDKVTGVLDIGCGDTFFASELSKAMPKANIYAVDIAFTKEHLETINKQDSRIKAFPTLEEAGLYIKQLIDVVLLLDVMEHVEHDIEFLRYVLQQKAVSDHTLFVISVPAFQKLFGYHDQFLGHYRRYTNDSLNSTIEKAGLQKSEIGYFFFSLLPIRIMQNLTEKFFKKGKFSTGLIKWNEGKIISGIIKHLLILDFRTMHLFKKLGINIIGLSNYVVCRKRPA
jgi:hypothetical protein